MREKPERGELMKHRKKSEMLESKNLQKIIDVRNLRRRSDGSKIMIKVRRVKRIY